MATGLIARTEARRRMVSGELDEQHRSSLGQYFTPDLVADFLASLIELPDRGRFTVLDPGAGIGSLSAAFVARVVRERPHLELHIVAFEIDPLLLAPLRSTLVDCEQVAKDAGRTVTTELRDCDFVAWAAATLGELGAGEQERFSACIMNPPYRKVNIGSPDRRRLEHVGVRVSNLYPAFLALAAALLDDDGQLSAITPRSFANGPYFEEFRRFFLARMTLNRLHVFERRGDVFADAKVLQENLVLHAVKGTGPQMVTLSVSSGYHDEPVLRQVEPNRVVRPDDPHLLVHIPIDEDANVVATAIATLPAALGELEVQVSTGKVVDFRAREYVIHDPDPETTVPLIYPTHLRGGRVEWPRLDSKKPNALERCEATASLLLPSETYVLVKRFTAKEERRRVVAGVFRTEDAPCDRVAFENHLNVYHRNGRGLPLLLALGLATFLNSSMVDDYVRQFSGHTQINATDLRLLRYPAQEHLTALGRARLEDDGFGNQTDVDRLVAAEIPAFPAGQGRLGGEDDPVVASLGALA